MALIEPNTMVSFIWGAHFYNTAHAGSDYDIVSVILPSVDDFLSGLQYRPKQKHDVSWLGSKIDVTRYSIEHFLSLISKGNIQLIELVMAYDPQHVIYYSDKWSWHLPQIKEFAKYAINHTNWRHIQGWMHKTMKKVDTQGMTVKRATLIYRMIIEARTWMKENKLVFKWPEIMDYAKDEDEKSILKALYSMRVGKQRNVETDYPHFRILLEERIQQGIDEVTQMFDEYVPPQKEYNIITHKQRLLKWIREHQIKEKGKNYWFGN